MTSPDPGSFRDPLSRVYVSGDEVLRGLSDGGLREFELVDGAPFFESLMSDGSVVATELLPADSHPLHEQWSGVLRHERIPVISYPYEWTFEMLRDAALLQIDVARRSIEAGFSTKDATSYNVVFQGSQPKFIDVGSFEKARPGEPWPGYRQFCELFLNPLVVQAATGVHFHPWLRGTLDGISASDVAAVVPLRKRLFRGLAVHVTLHARAERRYAEADGDVSDEMRQAGFGPKIVLAQLANLDKAVRRLKWKAQRSEWSDYSDRAHYVGDDLPAKDAFVASAVEDLAPDMVVDLGANDGRFSKLALAHGAKYVVAPDVDHLVVDKLYRHLRETGENRILPLVLDLANPSTGLGWRGRERQSFTDRVRPDLVLCLAVIHHLALSNTVPFEEIVALLADFDAPLVVEFPHPNDPMVKRLLSRKRKGLFDHYAQDNWEQALATRFTVDKSVLLPSGTRTLYRCSPITGSTPVDG
ncbi:MAG: methyltransferase [Aquihabitans sp.]